MTISSLEDKIREMGQELSMMKEAEEKYLKKIRELEEHLEEQDKKSKNHRNSIQLTSWKLDSISKEKEALVSQLYLLKDDLKKGEEEIGRINKSL